MIQTLIQKAQKGDVQAMTELFDVNKSTVCFLCRVLLQDETEADKAVIYVFNLTWNEIIESRITSEEELAKLFAVKVKIVKKALEDEAANVSKITALAEKHLKMKINMDAAVFHETIVRKAQEYKVSEKVEEMVTQDIRKICLPIQKRRKRKQIWIFAASCAAVLILCAVVGGLISGGTKETGSGESALTSTESDSENSSEEAETTEDSTETDTTSEENTQVSIEATHYADIAIEGYGTL